MEKQELFGENTRENIYHCIKCGLCIAHCPVYKELLLEEATPRGKVQLSRYLSEGGLDLSEDVKEAFFSTCLLCGSCVANCPSGVHGDHLFSGVRWRAVQRYGQQMEDVHVGLVREVGPQDVRWSLDRIETERGCAECGTDSGLQ
jgi:Fe-S oxidoreductase